MENNKYLKKQITQSVNKVSNVRQGPRQMTSAVIVKMSSRLRIDVQQKMYYVETVIERAKVCREKANQKRSATERSIASRIHMKNKTRVIT